MNITENSLLEYMLEISQEAAKELLAIHRKAHFGKLIMPLKRDKTFRLSEQELRIPCIKAIENDKLNHLRLYYAIEAPTDMTYRQKGVGERSGNSDLSLYEKDGEVFTKVSNIELKAHNATQENIRKDLEKLIKEELPGAWYHMLHNADSGTLKSLFGKFEGSIDKLINDPKTPLKPTASMLFTFLVLENGMMIARKVTAAELTQPQNVFKIDYKAMNAAISGDVVNNWMVFR